MGEWMLKMLNTLGFEEGMAIEDRSVSKGIERAQKKVEERNFSVRKNLLEYDEVMDYQRRIFYGQRQQILEGRDLSDLIWEMIDESIAQAVDKFLAPGYPGECIGEWCRTALEVSISPGNVAEEDFDSLAREIREAGVDAARDQIDINLGEYVAEDTPPEDWDLRSLSHWAETRWGITLSQNQLRKMTPGDIRDALLEAAEQRIHAADLSPVKRWLDPQIGKRALADWARGKFQITIEVGELAPLGRDAIESLMQERVRAGYREREVRYPVEWALETSIGQAAQGQVSERLRDRAAAPLGQAQVRPRLDGRADPRPQRQGGSTRNWSRSTGGTWRTVRSPSRSTGRWPSRASSGSSGRSSGSARRSVRKRCRKMPIRGRCCCGPGTEMLRYELTMLEQVVLLRIYDDGWKNHLYAMDRLKEGIGLRGYAERDPKIEYKREGFRMFQEMMSSIRENVTDMIFKVQIVDESSVRSVYQVSQTQHADATGAGLAVEPTPDQQAAMRSQGTDTPQVIQPIRRDVPKVGRNDPCPCGSGKKYKKCHGRGLGD